jgi:hypothetical protein
VLIAADFSGSDRRQTDPRLIGLKHLDSEAFAAADGDVRSLSLSALDLMRHGLAGDSEAFRGLVERYAPPRECRAQQLTGALAELSDPHTRRGAICSTLEIRSASSGRSISPLRRRQSGRARREAAGG